MRNDPGEKAKWREGGSSLEEEADCLLEKKLLVKCVCVCMLGGVMVYAAGGQRRRQQVPSHTCAGQTTTLSARLCHPPRLRQGLLASFHSLHPG